MTRAAHAEQIAPTAIGDDAVIDERRTMTIAYDAAITPSCRASPDPDIRGAP